MFTFAAGWPKSIAVRSARMRPGEAVASGQPRSSLMLLPPGIERVEPGTRFSFELF
jgi:hypothetical protein